MMKKYPYNPHKYTSASSLSGCFHWYLSKAIIALHTKPKHEELFEKTLDRNFYCVNIKKKLFI